MRSWFFGLRRGAKLSGFHGYSNEQVWTLLGRESTEPAPDVRVAALCPVRSSD